MRRLLDSAAKSNTGDVNTRGLTPLAEALLAGHLPCADLLLKQVGFWQHSCQYPATLLSLV